MFTPKFVGCRIWEGDQFVSQWLAGVNFELRQKLFFNGFDFTISYGAVCQFVISYGFDFTPKFVREVCLSIISNHRLCRQVHDMISAYVGQSLLPCYNFLRALGNLEL